MSDVSSIVSLRQVTLPREAEGGGPISGVDFTLAPGDMLIVRVAQDRPIPSLADVVSGLEAPEAGTALFEEARWEDRSPISAALARHHIGRVFRGNAWLSNLDVDENITLAERHHTLRPETEIRAEALDLARSFGLQALPALRPPWVERHTLQKGQWVRALLGHRSLLLFEHATEDAEEAECQALLKIVESRRAKGCAVIWLTADERVLKMHSQVEPSVYRISNARWEIADRKNQS